MGIIRGPFTLKWGDNTIVDVESIDVEDVTDSEDYTTIDGVTREIDGNKKATAVLTLLASDIPAQAAIMPQHFVANGEDLSTGETVDHAEGAMDYAPLVCDVGQVFNNLDIISCNATGDVHRLVNARTKFEGVEYDEKVRKVSVKFIAEPASGEATSQFFREGTASVVS